MPLNAADQFFNLEFSPDEDKAVFEDKMAKLIFRWMKLDCELEKLIEDSKQFEASLNIEDVNNEDVDNE